MRELWSLVKRFGAAGRIENVELREIPVLHDAVVEGYIDDRNRAILAALVGGLSAKTFFEIGTNRGRTAWTVVRNNPDLQAYTLDLPTKESVADVKLELNDSDRGFFSGDWDRGEAIEDTLESARITRLFGDSATFDYTPYHGRIDVVFIDGAHTYAYVRNDTEAGLRMLSPSGTLIWDDYPAIPGVYCYLTDLSRTLQRPMFHILGTRMVVCPGKDVVRRLNSAEYGVLESA